MFSLLAWMQTSTGKLQPPKKPTKEMLLQGECMVNHFDRSVRHLCHPLAVRRDLASAHGILGYPTIMFWPRGASVALGAKVGRSAKKKPSGGLFGAHCASHVDCRLSG